VVLAGVLALVLLAVLYYFLLLAPVQREYAAAIEQRVQHEAQREQLERQVAELERVRRDAPEIQRRILEYSKRIPDSDEIDTLLVQIQEIGDDSGVTWTSITPESPTAPAGGGDYTVIPITMSFEGTYEELLEFLTQLKNLSRLVTVNEVTYEEVIEEETTNGEDGEDDGGGDAGGDPNLLTVDLVAETYVQPAGAPVPVTPPPPAAGEAAGEGGSTAPPAGGTTGTTPGAAGETTAGDGG